MGAGTANGQVSVVYVHLGGNPSPIMLRMANYARQGSGVSQVLLITDHPRDWHDFPGEVVSYRRSSDDRWLNDLERRYPDKRLDSGGYWIHTLERLVALDRLRETHTDHPAVHLEGDVFATISRAVAGTLSKAYPKVAYPRVSSDMACASFVYIPSHAALESFVLGIRALAARRSHWFNDMELLSDALKFDLTASLPTDPNEALRLTDTSTNLAGRGGAQGVIFDGMAIGQYLFGQDPFHTNGVRHSGYIRGDFGHDLGSWSWLVESATKTDTVLVCQTKSEKAMVANIHLHAKVDPGPLCSPVSGLWRIAMDEANGVAPRRSHNEEYLGFQRRPAPIWARLASWKAEGWPRIEQSVAFRLSRLRKLRRK